MEDRTNDAASTGAANGSSCLIQRLGLVTKIDASGVTAQINGRTLLLSSEKVAEDVNVGDAIAWNGNIWTVSKGAAEGTSNMRKA